jgi:hypothetical protein
LRILNNRTSTHENGGGAKIKLTINEKILLHLLENHRARDEREAPQSITQRGIADSVGIRWNHVPRAVTKLKKLDYVFERLSHIEGKTRRQKAYFLTDEGLLSARNLRERVMDWDVYLVQPDGQRTKIRLSKVNSVLKSQFSPLRLIACLSDEGIIDAEELLEDPSEAQPIPSPRVFFVSGEIAWPDQLVGREPEIKKLTEWLSGTENGTAVIYGSIGIGKSALMAQIVQDFKGKKHIFWYQMAEGDTQRDILEQMSEFLVKIGNLKLSSYLNSHDTVSLSQALKLLEKDISGLKVLCAFDNYYKAGEDVVDLFSGLSTIASKSGSLKLLINAMDTTPFYCRFYDKGDVKRRKIAEMTLKGLDMESCKLLLEAPKIEHDALRKIHLITRGHPLTLLLIKRGDVNSLKRIKGFSRQEASLLLYLKGVETG